MEASAGIDLEHIARRLFSRWRLPFDAQQAVLALPVMRVDLRAKQDIGRLNLPKHSFVVSAGLVARYRDGAEGVRQITAFHLPGDLSDLHSAVGLGRRGGMYALSKADLLSIPHEALKSLIARFPSVAAAFWHESAIDMAILEQWVSNLGRRGAITRVAHLFCELAVRYHGRTPTLLRYHLPITQVELSDALGITGIHLNRVLKELRNQGLLRFKDQYVDILDWSALAALGEFDRSYLQQERPAERLRA